MRTIGVKLTADTTGYISGLQRAATATKDFTGQMDRAAKTGKLDAVAGQAMKFGIAGVAAFGLVVKSAADFDKQMSAVSAATHANTQDMAALREAAIAAGKGTQFSATQAAEGVTELAKAGVATADILGGGLKGSLALAAAGQLSVAEAAETSASALTQFKLKGDQVPHVADLLAAAAGKAQGSVHDMGMALNQSGLVASQFGLSIEDTTGVLAEFAHAGLIGSDAGTSFKTMLLAIANPASITRRQMANLGIEFYDAQGKFIGLSGVAQVLQDKLKGLTEEQRQQALGQIFGNDSIRAASVLYTDGAKGVDEWRKGVNEAGYATSSAAKLTDNLSGDIERLKGSMETLAIESGTGANGGLRVLVQSLGALVDQFGHLSPVVGSGLTVLAGVGGASALALAGFIKLRKGLADAVEQLNAMGPAGEKAATKLEKTAAFAGKAAAAFAALEVVGAVADHFGAAAANADRLTSALTNLANGADISGELVKAFGKNLDNFSDTAHTADAASRGFWGSLNDLTSSIPGVGSAIDTLNEHIYGTSFNHAKDSMDALDQALVQYMATTNDAAKASELWNRLLAKSGMNTDEFAALLPNAYTKLGDLNTAAMRAADSVNAVGGAAAGSTDLLDGVGSAAAASAADITKMKQSFDDLFKSTMSADQAEIRYRSALSDTSKELQTGAHSISTNTEEGRKNRTAVLSQIDAINDLRTATVNQGGSIEAADKKYKGQIETLRKHLLALGYDKTAVEKLIGRYEDIPSKVDTKLSVSGYDAVTGKLDRLAAYQQGLKAGTIKPGQFGPYRGADGKYFADGGWTGPGAKYQPAGVVHADEFVIQKSSRQSIEANHPGALDTMNRTGALPGHADGGRVVWPFPVTAARTKIPTLAQVLAAVTPSFGQWPSSPSAQRGDSGVWRSIVAMIKATGPISGSFGNAYRAGDPLWHGSGRAVDWMGFNQDRLASFLAAKRPLELIHRTAHRDYAYTRGVNKGSFNNALMEAHRNHVHIAMAGGGVIGEPVIGVGASGASYSFAERGPETVSPGVWSPHANSGGGDVYHVTVQAGYVVSEQDLENKITRTIDRLQRKGRL